MLRESGSLLQWTIFRLKIEAKNCVSNRNVWTNRNARNLLKTKDAAHFYSRQIHIHPSS